jgi:Cu(I)/Ag(I) efflux system membrane fusion protein
VKVSNLNAVWAAFDVYENQISEFKKGQKIKVTTKAHPNREFEATLTFIDPVLNTQTRTLTVRADLINDGGLFKPGMFVTGKLEGKPSASEKELTIPASAVLWTGERSLVYEKTAQDEPIFEIREITLGQRLGDVFIVVSGLGEGAEIVTHGAFNVDAAAQLQGKKSMMNQGKKDETGLSGAMELSARLQNELLESLPSYLKLKDAFVASDAKAVSAYAKAMAEKINAIPVKNVPPMAQAHS